MGMKDSFINMISFIKIKYTNIDTKLTELKNTVTSLSTNFDNLSNEFNDIGGVVDYTDKISFNITNLNNKWSTSIKKVGHTVNFIIDITVNATSTNIAELGTLPEEVLTKKSIVCNTISNNGYPCYIYIDPDGTFGFNRSDKLAWTKGDGIRECFNYVV